ncbi:MAG: tetratricopeptide repeat protein, partial [Verrucomicrobia bacterium]|nr:tetratricopeptide repeat protein [Verrucomicrobiota bacterium]
MKLPLFFLILLPALLPAAPAELPKDLRTAEEMIQDGLGRDAAARIRIWLQKNSSSPQPYAQLLLAEALLSDHRPEEALTALPKTPPADLDTRVRMTRASALTELGRWKEATTAWKEAKSKNLSNGLASQVRLGLATALLNQNETTAGIRELREILKEPKSPSQDSARLLLVKALIADGKPDEADKELLSFPEETPPPVRAEAR